MYFITIKNKILKQNDVTEIQNIKKDSMGLLALKLLYSPTLTSFK